MASELTVDVFKFVAIRPIQLTTPTEDARISVRDARVARPEGLRDLRLLARELATADGALSKWQSLDLTHVKELAAYIDPLRAVSAALAVGQTLDASSPPAGAALSAARVVPIAALWDTVYTADRTGVDAGRRIETPMAALRVKGLCELLSVGGVTREQALDTLSAALVIPTFFYQPAGASADLHDAPRPAPAAQTERSQQLRTLASEIVATEQLLSKLTNAPPPLTTLVTSDDTDADQTWTRRRATLANARPIQALIGNRYSAREGAVMDKLGIDVGAPVPAAAMTLQAHLISLNEVVAPLADDTEFIGFLRENRSPFFTQSQSVADISYEHDIGGYLLHHQPGTAPDVNVSGRIRPLGIGDLKVVKQTLLGYYDGEVAHIENVLKGESRERSHRKLDRSETTVFTSDESTTETERNTQSTDRYEVKREAEQTIKEDMSIKAGLTVTASFGPVVTTATGDFAYSTSRQQSEKSSLNFARELVDRSVSKVQTKVRVERTAKTFSEAEEINKHRVDNSDPGNEHIVGIYRWVDKRYRAQVYNYGRRLMLEFVLPEPAAFYRAAKKRDLSALLGISPPPPLVNELGKPLGVSDITPALYRRYVSRYQVAGVSAPPPLFVFVGTTLTKEGIEQGAEKATANATKEFTVPEGYVLNYYSATVTALWRNHAKMTVQIGRDEYPVLTETHPNGAPMKNIRLGMPDEITTTTGSVPVSVATYDVLAYALNVQGLCAQTPEKLATWQHQTYDKIVAAYQAQQNAYDQRIAQATGFEGIRIEGRNPGANRVIEQLELKKLCITMMTGQHFGDFNAMTDPANQPTKHPEVDVLRALADGPIVQFFEQAFEWEQMTYLFYSYFWGRKQNWVNVSQLTSEDPLFERFLTAGAARVIVPVPLQYKNAVLFLLQSDKPALADRVWRGGERLTLDDPLYRSLEAELRDQTDDLQGATPEGTPWEFTVPTTLVHLQDDGTLPVFP